MVGDVYIDEEGTYYETVWSGGELLPWRETLTRETWTAPHRLYNKTGKHKRPITPKLDILTDPAVTSGLRLENVVEDGVGLKLALSGQLTTEEKTDD